MVSENRAVEEELIDWFKNSTRVVVAGIGNPIRRDDFVGIKIVQDLIGKVPENVLLLECETVPESFIQDIVDFNPSHVLLIDAAVLGLKPGQTRFVTPEIIDNFSPFSTHTLPLRIFCQYITSTTNSRIALLLVEPNNVDFGEGLTPELVVSAERIAKELQRILS